MIAATCPICLSQVHTNRVRIAREILRHGCDECRGLTAPEVDEPSWIRYRIRPL